MSYAQIPAEPRYAQCLSCAKAFDAERVRATALPCSHDSYCVQCAQTVFGHNSVCIVCPAPIEMWHVAAWAKHGPPQAADPPAE